MNLYRDDLVSAAQVAKHYGAYTLDEALALSREKRRLLLAVSAIDDDNRLQQLERSLGIIWDVQDFLSLSAPSGGARGMKADGSTQISPRVKIPLALAMAAEFLQKSSETMRSRVASADASYLQKGEKVREVGTMSTEDAMAFWK
jgi:hypothetical protein